MTETELQACLNRIVERDETALARLYDALVAKVFGLVRRIVLNEALAEEVTEDVFWQIWRQAPRFDPERGCVLAWVMTMARSRALDALRRQDPAALSLDDEDEAGQAHEALVVESRVDEWLSAVQQNALVRQALEQVAPLPRQLLALSFFRGLSHDEIAEHTGLPLGTVKTHIRRALLLLRDLLAIPLAGGVP